MPKDNSLRSKLQRIVEPVSKRPPKPDTPPAGEVGFSPVEVTDSVKEQKMEGVRALVQADEEQRKKRAEAERFRGYHVTRWSGK